MQVHVDMNNFLCRNLGGFLSKISETETEATPSLLLTLSCQSCAALHSLILSTLTSSALPNVPTEHIIFTTCGISGRFQRNSVEYK